MKRLLLCLVSGFVLSTNSAQWVWNNDPTINNEVCTVFITATKTNLVSTSDGAGGMWIAWEDSRNAGTTGTDIYIQRLKHDGSIALAAAGLVVCDALLNQSSITITDDGAGGCIVAWTDGRATNNDVYAQRFNSAGTAVWAANGVAIANTTGTELGAVLTKINATEVMIAWRDDRNNTMFSTGQDYFVNKLDIATGAKLWMTDYELVRGNNTQTNLRLLADGSGNAFATWQDPRVANTNADIYVQKINNNGTGAWTNYGINLTVGATFNQASPQLISDGAGGIIVVWDDNRATLSDQAIYAQRVDASGVPQWTANGALVADVTGSNSRTPQLCTDGASGAYIAWQDTRNAATGNDLYAQRINASGTALWAANGIVVSNGANSQPNATANLNVIADGNNGAIIVFDDATTGTSDIDIKAQRYDAMGNAAWTVNGTAVATKTGSNQRAPVAVFSATQSVIVAWPDARSGTANTTIYASRIFPNGALPLQFVNINATLQNNAGFINWQTANEVNTAHFMVEKSSDGRNFKSIGSVPAKGSNGHEYELTDKSLLTGDNFYRIKSVDKDGQFQYSAIATLKYGKKGIIAVSLYPNPANDNLQLQLANLEKGKYQLRIINLHGAVVVSRAFVVNSTLQQEQINLSTMSSGAYQLQLIDAAGQSVQTKSFIKQ
jgi:hypothetical protein